MKTLLTPPCRKATALAALLALAFSLPAVAALYTFDYTDAGLVPQVVPQVGTALSVEHVVGGWADTSITSVHFTLTFNDNASLLGTSGGIQGHLILGSSAESPFVNFYPVESLEDGSYTYSATFSGSSGSPGVGFNGLDPNNTWGLVLWDNSESGIENWLTGFSLEITAVPEPINVALGIFAGGALAVHGARRWRGRSRSGFPGLPPA